MVVYQGPVQYLNDNDSQLKVKQNIDGIELFAD